ncbi:MAG: hypothetical protein KKC30_15840 [Proteobacteria bacterium]|nr:hypothetical protein [Pseudomonadota bacterium]MBU4381604.1 hypothetical protein [Pseudomonadota bacterium]MCG2766591.1 hypothetical protein [Desulfarculaceae bacterium]
MKKEAKLLMIKAIDSLVLCADHFNRPWDQGRVHAILIFLDHSFEMLLKAAIIERGSKIREKGAKETIGFDKCVRKCYSDASVQFLTDEQVLTLQAINGYRDAAQHYLLDISEQHLYLQAQAGLTLFKDILKEVFEIDIYSRLPRRVLPLSTTPPTDLHSLFSSEVEEVKRLLTPGKRRGVEASSKIRALAIMEGAINGEKNQPSQGEINKISKQISKEVSWESLFPGVASINMTQTGYGPSLDLRITKNEGIPVHLVPEGTPDAYVVGVRKINELDYYSLGLKNLADKLGITQPKAHALVQYFAIQNDAEFFKEIRVGKTKFKRYSPKALATLRDIISEDTTVVEKAWREIQAAKGREPSSLQP